ncbi:MAG: COP23 domain-containing protein [Pegethrix bostrychoides GSE-TBD4-15B]|uniref:COP23 domain-containing protein n=1 Tax=Pegethrix bostrychoides GSE-TBD4-15B TaxID=2839662 RepID=A0A951U4Q0_9CYAN|nr:COP23 domain-containing protein [Pegethrix bostrychoides GSE-TBD4-15B]
MNSSASQVRSSVRLAVGLLLLGSNLAFANSAQALPDWVNQILSNSASSSASNQSISQGSTSRPAPRSAPVAGERSAPASSTNAPNSAPANSQLDEVRFSCQVANGEPTVMYSPQSQPGKYYAWATPTALGGGWSSERRCNEISRRLEFYRPDGLLELQTGLENGYNTVCVTTEALSACRIVLTVPPGQNPVAIRDRIFNNLLVADSGQQTTAVTAYQDSGSGILNQIGQALGVDLGASGGSARRSPSSINLRPFLDTADGGTGARLSGAAAGQAGDQSGGQSGTRLNPGNFR